MVRRVVLVVVVSIVALVAVPTLLLGAFLYWVGPADLPWAAVKANMEVRPIIDGDTLTVTGSTDLADGALIDYVLSRDDAINEGPVGVVEVHEGAFSFQHDVSGLRRGKWTLEVSFSTMWGPTQPKHVTDIYGAEGEHLDGPQVYVDSPGDPKQLLVLADIDVQ